VQRVWRRRIMDQRYVGTSGARVRVLNHQLLNRYDVRARIYLPSNVAARRRDSCGSVQSNSARLCGCSVECVINLTYRHGHLATLHAALKEKPTFQGPNAPFFGTLDYGMVVARGQTAAFAGKRLRGGILCEE
jgi:hypothetical protein